MVIKMRAALFHFCGSVLLIAPIISFVFLVWYPYPLHEAVGLGHVIFILAGVDAAIGPFLTFVVYKKEKKSLRFDLAVIVLLQALALIYGLASIAKARPAWLVFNMDRFDLVQAQDLDSTRIEKAPLQYRSAPWNGPKWVASRNPDDLDAHNTLMFESAQGGADLPQRIDLYLPLDREADAIRSRAKSIDELSKFNSDESIKLILKKWPEADGWLPLAAKKMSMIVLIRRSDAKVLTVADLRPWKGE
jgi:hypothetical protein